MNVNVDAVLAVSGLIFVSCAGGLSAILVMMRRQDRAFRREIDRLHR